MLKIIFYVFALIGFYLFLFSGYTGIIKSFIMFLIVFCLIYANRNFKTIIIK